MDIFLIASSQKINGGAVKITDDFSVLPESLKLLQNVNDSKASILISDCVFEINQNSDCSLFYAKEKGFTKNNVEHCTFNGNLANGAHYIDWQIALNNPSIFIKSCKFSVDENKALNDKFNINKVQLLKENSFGNEKLFSKMILMTLSTFIGVVVILIAITIMKRNQSNDNSQSQESNQV